MSRASRVSVVIPVKDDAEYLRRCLAALAAQTRAPREVVVVDNGSTDASRRVARRYGARLVRERRPGIPAAASRGYDAARGRVIARLDADSVPPRDWVARRRRVWRRLRRRVHRDDRRVHDDLDLSIHLAGMPVRLDPDLRVAVSARPLRSPVGMVRRVGMALWTLAQHPPGARR